jgi:hypothetical protein
LGSLLFLLYINDLQSILQPYATCPFCRWY